MRISQQLCLVKVIIEYFQNQPFEFLDECLVRTGSIAWFLWPFSLVFGMVVAIRRYGYRKKWLKSVRLPVPVVIVGNIFVGGTGKTPMVIWLVKLLQKAGFHPGVISRGYGTSNGSPVEVSSSSKASESGMNRF